MTGSSENADVPYHVYLFQPYDVNKDRGRGFYFVNLSEEHLRERIVAAWDRGTPITYDGETADSTISKIKVFSTDDPIQVEPGTNPIGLMEAGEEVTNDWIVGSAGAAAAASSTPSGAQRESVLRDHRRVMVVHGRNHRARDAMVLFLRALGLDPIEWDQAVRETGTGTPHNLEAVRAAMEIGQAVVVVLTAEDRAGLLPSLAEEGDDDVTLRGQPRQNVILEAGLAMGIDPARVILVELGTIRPASDFAGLNTVRLTNAAATRVSLRTRLQTAGCAVAEGGSDWTRSDTGGDFEAAIAAEPEASS